MAGIAAAANLGLSNATGGIGDTVAVVVELSDASSVTGIEIHLEYSTQFLSYVQVSSTVLSNMTVNDTNGTFHLIWEDFMNPVNAVDPINIATIEYEILPDLVDSAEITFMDLLPPEIVDDIGDPIALTTTNGWVIYNQSTDIFENENNNVLPDDYYLEANHPNPFNPSTIINFGLPRLSNVTLSVYNIIGQKVTTLVDLQLRAGRHSYIWDGKNLASGVYFYQLKANEFTYTRKMILLK